MDTIEKIREDALRLVLDMADAGAGGEDVKKIYTRYSEQKARYKHGDKVWYMEGLHICKCEIVGVYVNKAGCDFYRIGEVGGRTIMGNAFIPGREIFRTREDLVDAVKQVIGL